MNTNSDHLATVMAIYEAFGRGDVAAILERLADDVSWDEGLRPTGLPYLAPRRGKQQVAGFFADLMANFELTRFDLGTPCVGTDQVIVPLVGAGRNVVSGGSVSDTVECHIWTFGADGRVTRFMHVFDYAVHELAAQNRGVLDGRVLRAVGDEITVLQSGGNFEVFELSGPAESGPPPHAHPWDESYYVLEGRVAVTCGDEQATFGPGQFATVPAGTVHTYRIESPTAKVLVMTSGARAAAFFADLDANAPSGPPTPATLPAVIEVARRNGITSPLFDAVSA